MENTNNSNEKKNSNSLYNTKTKTYYFYNKQNYLFLNDWFSKKVMKERFSKLYFEANRHKSFKLIGLYEYNHVKLKNDSCQLILIEFFNTVQIYKTFKLKLNFLSVVDIDYNLNTINKVRAGLYEIPDYVYDTQEEIYNTDLNEDFIRKDRDEVDNFKKMYINLLNA